MEVHVTQGHNFLRQIISTVINEQCNYEMELGNQSHTDATSL